MTSYDHIVLVRDDSRLDLLKARYNTLANARFYLERQGLAKDFEDLQAEDHALKATEQALFRQLSDLLPVKVLKREFVTNYLFSASDLVVVVGRDGLVANTAKYALGRPLFGVNPSPSRYSGRLLPFDHPGAVAKVRSALSGSHISTQQVRLAEARLDDGQHLLAFNDLFIGRADHRSAHYSIEWEQQLERQSSSGLIVSTGAGASGWLSSVFNMASGIYQQLGQADTPLAQPTLGMDAPELWFAVREPYASPHSGTEHTIGRIERNSALRLISHMPEGGVIFSDGILQDYLQFTSGRIAQIGLAAEQAVLVQP